MAPTKLPDEALSAADPVGHLPPHSAQAEGEANPPAAAAAPTTGKVQVIRRNGQLTRFDATKIMVAMTKAFLAVEGGTAATSSRVHERVRELTDQVVAALLRRAPAGGTVHIEDIRSEEHNV